jgi:hypothetical protein
MLPGLLIICSLPVWLAVAMRFVPLDGIAIFADSEANVLSSPRTLRRALRLASMVYWPLTRNGPSPSFSHKMVYTALYCARHRSISAFLWPSFTDSDRESVSVDLDRDSPVKSRPGNRFGSLWSIFTWARAGPADRCDGRIRALGRPMVPHPPAKPSAPGSSALAKSAQTMLRSRIFRFRCFEFLCLSELIFGADCSSSCSARASDDHDQLMREGEPEEDVLVFNHDDAVEGPRAGRLRLSQGASLKPDETDNLRVTLMRILATRTCRESDAWWW